MDNIYKAVQLTVDSQNLALSKTPTHVYIANQYVDTNDTPLITAPFIIQKALENGTGVVDIVSSTIGSIYEVRLLCDAEVLISGYFYMPPMNVAPHTGAWIETALFGDIKIVNRSHPTRVRGLKLPNNPNSSAC